MTDSDVCSASPCPDGLLCAIALDPESLPRNRYFWVYAEPRARRAHGRAYSLRRLNRQLVELLKNDHVLMMIGEEDRGVRIAYRDESLALVRRIHLGGLEASLIRLLLFRAGVQAPEPLRVRDGDRRRVAAALQKIRTHPDLPDPSGWIDRLPVIAPGVASNTTE